MPGETRSESDRWEGLSTEIGPPLFPRVVAGSAPSGGLLRGLFGLAPPNSHSQMVSRGSFANMDFCGGEDDAQDAWRDKWEAHRRSSVDETNRSPHTSPLGSHTSAPRSIPGRGSTDLQWAVSNGGMGASFASSGSASSSGASTPTRGLSLGTDPRVHGLGGQPVDALRSKFFGSSYPPR
mmetsp:Transcript_9811/g.27359  ORF Transcript_9811/g.27359 Transcript_9811/m.27359 type:complete len:180 (-) Transcript_9811:56-595(-)